MNSLLILIPLAILLLVGAGVALFWAVDRGQFDNMEAAALLPLFDADTTAPDVVTGERPDAEAHDVSGRPS